MIRGLYNHFNRGEIDEHLLARDDVDKLKQSGSYVENFMPMKFGPMYFREGTELVDTLTGSSYDPCLIPFIRAADDTALIELNEDGYARIWVDDTLITRPAITSYLSNDTFDTDLSSWIDASGAGASTAWGTGGYAKLTGTSTTDAVLYQTTSSQQANAENGLKVVVAQGELVLELGTSGVGSSDIYSGMLEPGVHHIVFTPGTGETVTVTLRCVERYYCLVDSVEYVSDVTVTLPHGIAAADVKKVRFKQSADVIFCACDGYPQFKIERRSTKSWSLVKYRPSSGPYGLINTTKKTMEVSSPTAGNITLTCSQSHFTPDHVGTLFKIVTLGQMRQENISAEDNGTESIFVTGADAAARKFDIYVNVDSGAGTITLQRSVDNATWEDVETYTTNQNKNYNDTLYNADLYYRLWIKSGDYTSGTIVIRLTYSGGSTTGECRVTNYSSHTAVIAEVLSAFGSGGATKDWYEGEWSGEVGYPTAVEINEGRLWWAGRNKIWGSVSDNYYKYAHDYDDEDIGDSAEIRKTIGFGPVENVLWLQAGTRMLMGLASSEISVRSSSLGEILTPTNTNLKEGSTIGSSDTPSAKIDATILFVQRYGRRLYALDYDLGSDGHLPQDMSMFRPLTSGEEIVQIVSTRNPESRVWCRLSDGGIRVFTVDRSPLASVSAWTRWATDGTVRAMAVMPGTDEDTVYLVIDRTNGRYLEKKADYFTAQSITAPEPLDSFIRYTSPGTTITGLSHLEGETVTVWADGQNRGTFIVSSGQITVGSSWTTVIVGLAYTATWVSNKLGGFVKSSVLSVRKRVVDVGLIAAYLWSDSIKVGPDSSTMYPMPAIEGGKEVSTSGMETYHEMPFEFEGESVIDPRIHIEATGPCVIQALMFGLAGKDPSSVAALAAAASPSVKK